MSLAAVRYCIQTHEHADHLDPINFLHRSPFSGVESGNPRLEYFASRGALAKAAAALGRRAPNGLSDSAAEAAFNVNVHVVEPFKTFDVGPYLVAPPDLCRPTTTRPWWRCSMWSSAPGGRSSTRLRHRRAARRPGGHLEAARHRFDVVVLDHTFGFSPARSWPPERQAVEPGPARPDARPGLTPSDWPASIYAHHRAPSSDPSLHRRAGRPDPSAPARAGVRRACRRRSRMSSPSLCSRAARPDRGPARSPALPRRPPPPRWPSRRGVPLSGRSPVRVRRSTAAGSPSTAAVRAATVRTSPARHDDQAFGEVARASASVSARSRASASAEPTCSASVRAVAGSSGSRVVAVSASSRCRRTSTPTSSTAASSKPIRLAIARASGSPATLCSVRPPLPMSCSSAATSSTSGRATPPDQRRCLHAGLDDVPVDGEPVDRRGVRQQPDPLPLGQERRQRSGLLEGLPDRQQPGPGGEQPDQRLPGRASATGPAARRPRATSRAAVAGASSTSRSAATAAARSSRVGSAPGRASRVEHDLATARARPPARPAAAPAAASRRRTRPGQDAVDPAPGQPRQVGDPAAELAHVPLGGRRRRPARAARRGRPRAPARPGRWPGRRRRGARRARRAGRRRRALEVDVRARRPARSRPAP